MPIREQWAKPGTGNPGVGVDVAVTPTIVLEHNPRRRYASFTNDSDAVIYLHCGPGAALNSHRRLNALGGGFEIIEGQNAYIGVVTAIHGGVGAKRLCVEELEG